MIPRRKPNGRPLKSPLTIPDWVGHWDGRGHGCWIAAKRRLDLPPARAPPAAFLFDSNSGCFRMNQPNQKTPIPSRMNITLSLQGKVALVTGGGRGIGKAITQRLAAAGANVVIASRKMENLEATAREFAALPGKVVPIACHVGRKDQARESGARKPKPASARWIFWSTTARRTSARARRWTPTTTCWTR